jgi:hypothetical protein
MTAQKMLSLLIAAALAFAILAGCNQGNSPSEKKATGSGDASAKMGKMPTRPGPRENPGGQAGSLSGGKS